MAHPLPADDPQLPTPKHLLHEGTPAEIRGAILPEEREQFDASYRAALDTARDTLSLTPVDEFLAHWRRIAAAQAHEGHDKWRELMDRADYTLRHGQPPAGTVRVPAEEHRDRLAQRLAAGH